MVEKWQQMGHPVQHFLALPDLIQCLKQELQPQDVILLKGSRAKKMWLILDAFMNNA